MTEIKGNVESGGGDFVGRDSQNVNVNLQPYHYRERLMPSVEEEFRRNFSGVTDALTKLNGTVEVNNALTKLNIEAIKEQVRQAQIMAEKTHDMVLKGLAGVNVVIPEKADDINTWFKGNWVGICVLIVLSFIAYRLTLGG